MRPVLLSLVLAALVLAGCVTTDERERVDAAERAVRLFIEYCMDHVGRPEDRVALLETRAAARDGVFETTGQSRTTRELGFPVRWFTLEGKEQLELHGPDARHCTVYGMPPPLPTNGEIVAALDARLNGSLDAGTTIGQIWLYNVEAHATPPPPIRSINATIAIGRVENDFFALSLALGSVNQ